MEARALHIGDLGYPARIAALDDAPPTIWISGRWTPAAHAVAVVGARAATGRGMALARAIGADLGKAGVDVISGGAIGIDAAAHRGALDVSSMTVAVLGTGIDIAYPSRHAPLFSEIVAGGGALLTQFAPGREPRSWTFPARNKIVAALADVTVVVEASTDSGSLHTARAAGALGRRVVAVPGTPGCDQLLLSGAQAATSADDVLAILQGRPLQPPELPPDPDAARLYAVLDEVPRDVGDLAFRAGLAVGTCAAMVIDLELGGLVARAAGGRYLRLR